MVPLHRVAAPALAFLALFGSCDRVSTPQESELPGLLDLRFGVWTDSVEAARDSLRSDRPHEGSITVGDTLWVRVEASGDTDRIRSVDAFFAGSWRPVPLPVFFPASWTDSGLQKVKVALFTDDGQYFDSALVRVTDQTPKLRLPELPEDGALPAFPGATTSLHVGIEDDGRVDSLRWDLDGDGTVDTATAPSDTLRLRWTVERILQARAHPFLRVLARDEDGNQATDSIPLLLRIPPPTLTLSGPDTVSVGDTLRISAAAAGDAGLLPVTWADSTTGDTWLAPAPAIETTITVVATLRDSMGGADTAFHTVVVVRDVPDADAGSDTAVHAGRAIRLSGAATQRFGSVVSWGWDLDNDGIFRSSPSSAGVDTTWETVGTRTVVLRVQDDDGNVDLDTIRVDVTDSVPTLGVAFLPVLARRDSATLAATASDPDGDSLVVLWVVDGDTTTGSSRRVAFDSVGIHLVRAVVRSFTPAGTPLATATWVDTLLVVADPPRLDLGPDTTVAWGGTWRAARATASDSTGTIATTDWDWNGDGTWDTTVAGFATPSRRFDADTGRILVRARVTDDDGNAGVDSLALRVDPAPWNVALVAPATSPRLADIVARISWTDSVTSGTSVRWTSNEGMDSTRTPVGDADSVVVQGRLVDTLRLTATLATPGGTVTVRSVDIVLDPLAEGPEIFLSGPDTVSWGDSIVVAAETVGEVDPAAIQWWNGTTGILARTLAPSQDTVLQLLARIRDDLGRTDSSVHTVVVVRDVPTANAGSDTSIHAGRLLRLSGAATQRFGSIVSWGWDLDNDGLFRSSPTNAGIDTTFETVGTRIVVLRVTDDDGNVDLDSVTITVTDAAPTLALTVPDSTRPFVATSLVATASDPDGDSLVVGWVIGADTTLAASVAPVFTTIGPQVVRAFVRSYTPSGTLLRTVSVSDTLIVSTNSAPPVLSLVAPDTVSWNDPFDLVASVVGLALPDSIRWSFGATGDSIRNIAPANDTDLVYTLSIVDSLGRTDSLTHVVHVVRDVPTADAGSDTSVHAGRLLRLSGAATQRFGNIVEWAWDLDNDGLFRSSPTNAGIDTTFETVGTRIVVLRVTDDDGNVDLDTVTITVTDAAPTLALEFPSSVQAPDSATLVASATDPDDDSLVVSWVVDGDTLEGATRQATFSRGGSNTVVAIVRSYTRSRGTFLAQTVDSGTILVTSSLSVDLPAPDTIWADTLVSGLTLQALVDAPTGVDSILWSFDSGATWTPGSPSGSQSWVPQGLGPKSLIVRAVDRFGSSASDTAVVQLLQDRPILGIADSITVASGSRSSTIPLAAKVRFGGISTVRWRWTDIDSANVVDQAPTGGADVLSPLVRSFPPGRFTVHVTATDSHGDSATDSVVVSSVGLRARFTVAPDSVAAGSDLHAEGTVDVWPSDSAVQTGFAFGGEDIADGSVLDTRAPEPGIYPLDFWANFVGSQTRSIASLQVEVIDDPPVIQSFADDTIAEGTAPDLGFTASRTLGGISAWVWDLSGATGSDNVLQGFATHSNDREGTLAPVPFLGGSRPVGYGVVGDGGDTTWVVRNFLVVGRPDAVDDVLGIPGRNGLDIGCEVGADCEIYDNLLLGNDLVGTGLDGSPRLVSALDGAVLDSNSDGSFVRLPAPSTAGVDTFRYVISNGTLQDTGTVRITIYERTEAAGFDASSVGVAYAENTTRRSWGPGLYNMWTQVVPLKDLEIHEYAGFFLEVPKTIVGAQLRTGNIQNAAGQDSVAPAGADLHAIDPNLSFYLEHGPTDWMVGELESHEFRIRVGTRRKDGLGVPGQVAWADYLLPVTFERLVVPEVRPNEKWVNFRPSYGCDGMASYEYLIDVDPVRDPHKGDFLRISIQDLTWANNGKGLQDGDITATFTESSGKPVTIEFKRDSTNWISATLPSSGGSLTLRYNLVGLLDETGNPRGRMEMGWVSSGGNLESSRLTQRPGATYSLENGCFAQ